MDAGGGTGALACALLRARPGLSAHVFDRPEVVAQAKAPDDLRARLSFIAGDLFAPWPATADALVLADVYPAGEAPIVAADGRTLARALRVAGRVDPVFVESAGEMAAAVRSVVRDGDVVVTMGAGSIAGLAPDLARPRRAAA